MKWWISRDPLKGVEMKEGPNLYAYVRDNPVYAVDLDGLGKWNFGVANTFGDGNNAIDVTYQLDDSDKCKCTEAIVEREVKKIFLGFPDRGGSYTNDDSPGGGGYWGPVTRTAHAEGDQPQGAGFAGYRFAWDMDFRFTARCTAGKAKGQVLSTAEKTYHVDGHWNGSNYNGHF